MTKNVEGVIELKLDLKFDDRDPSQWGTHPIMLWVSPVINQSLIENVNEVRRIAFALNGPIGSLLKEALEELKPGLGSLRPRSLGDGFSEHEKEL